MNNHNSSQSYVLVFLLTWSAIPVLAGSIRVFQLGLGIEIIPVNERAIAEPAPIVVHIVSASVYTYLGAFQFSNRLRNPASPWHRRSGKIVLVAGLVAALSGLYLSHFFPWAEQDGMLLYGLRLLFGSMMTLCILLGLLALTQRSYHRHQQWMIRGYALALAAGTQSIVLLSCSLILGSPSETLRAVLMGSSWVFNLVIAETIIRSPAPQAFRLPTQAGKHSQ